MPTSLAWNDGAAATLDNVAGTGFIAWTPFPDLIGPKYAPLGTGRQVAWTHRTDYCVRLQLTQIPRTRLALIDRLFRHLLAGGDVTVNVGDPANRVYTAHLRAGTTPEMQPPDRRTKEYAITLELVNNAAAPFIAEY